MNFKSVDTPSVLSALFIGGLVLLPVAALFYAGHASQPKDRPVRFEDQYPDEHMGIG